MGLRGFYFSFNRQHGCLSIYYKQRVKVEYLHTCLRKDKKKTKTKTALSLSLSSRDRLKLYSGLLAPLPDSPSPPVSLPHSTSHAPAGCCAAIAVTRRSLTRARGLLPTRGETKNKQTNTFKNERRNDRLRT